MCTFPLSFCILLAHFDVNFFLFSSDSDSEEEDNEEEEEMMELSSSDSDDDNDDEDDDEPPPASSRSKKKSSPSPPPKLRTIATPRSRALKKQKTTVVKKGTAAAWKSLTKGVLDDNETPENSILAALLQAGSGAKSKGKNFKLDDLTRRLIRDHHQDANAMHVRLYNFIFRVCGASTEANMPTNADLENLGGEEFGEYISAVVKSMEGSDMNTEVLWTAAPPSATVKLQFRALFQDFFYGLGMAAMETTASPSATGETDEEQDSDDDDEETGGGAQSSMRFQVEVARSLIDRLIEIAFLQQEDLRAAVVSALYSFATALLSKTEELREKLQTAQRQLQAAKRNKQKRKSEALKTQVDTGRRTIEDLEEIVKESILSIFMKRYKDTCPHVRAASMVALGDFAVIRPDIFFDKKYLKYPGWTLNDKDAVVREAALAAFLRPVQKRPPGQEAVTKLLVDKFCDRWTDCTKDVDTRVQERATELLLYMSRESYMDNVDDEEIWNQINLRALQADTTPEVRRLGLLFVIEQLGAFDDLPDQTSTDIAKFSEMANWTAHQISMNEIPFDQIHFEYCAYIIQSMRACKEYFSLARNFDAMVQALDESLSTKLVHSGKKGREERSRNDAKQRVLLEFLITAVEEEVQLFSPDNVFDPDLRAIEPHGKKGKTAPAQEELTRALLPTLPRLMNSFKTETPLLRRLAELPVYFGTLTVQCLGLIHNKRN